LTGSPNFQSSECLFFLADSTSKIHALSNGRRL